MHLCDKYGNFTLYLWTGSCDLTFKRNFRSFHAPYSRKPYWLSLFSDYALRANKIIRAFNRLLKFANLKNFEVVIHEIPYYCIQACNDINGYRSTENFARQDKILHDTTDELNAEIRKLNKNRISPKFNCDLKN